MSVGDDNDDAVRVEVDGLAYELDGPLSRSGRRSVVRVRQLGGASGARLVDRLDLLSHRARLNFAGLVAESFARDRGSVLGHLALLLDSAERGSDDDKPDLVVTPERRRAAEVLLGRRDLLEHAARALDLLGLVGEDRPRRLGLLVAISRMLDRPTSALFLAPAGTGKSTVLDAIAALTPPEHVQRVERLTPTALFYAGPRSLAHKLLLVDELEGQAEAAHALRVLQSRGELRLQTTVGGRAEAFVARGPVAVMSGTTSSNLDAQNSSRCMLVPLDDSREQTARVHQAQARSWSGAECEPTSVQVWHDAQRVLERVRVTIPFAGRLVFPVRTTTDRRASAKVLSLVAAHALLHQRRRERDQRGRLLATVDDYRVVHDLVASLMAQERDGLSARAIALLGALGKATTITRHEAAQLLSWSYSTARRAIDELVEREALRLVTGEYPRRWRLVESVAASLEAGGALTDPDDLA